MIPSGKSTIHAFPIADASPFYSMPQQSAPVRHRDGFHEPRRRVIGYGKEQEQAQLDLMVSANILPFTRSMAAQHGVAVKSFSPKPLD